jgi:hypothetical protein
MEARPYNALRGVNHIRSVGSATFRIKKYPQITQINKTNL